MSLNGFDVSIPLSKERFKVAYHLRGTKEEAQTLANEICIEQTIEFPPDLVTKGDIRDHIFGRLESLEPVCGDSWEAVISYAIETVGMELTQLLNVIFGNSSLKPWIRVERLEFSQSILNIFKGPRFGIQGLRKLLDVPRRPLFCTAIKPMGLPVKDLEELAYRFALGGVDMIKDDHGLADQPFHPYKERVERCAQAVLKANAQTGGKCLYIPNLSCSTDQIVEKAYFAKEKGAGALMIAPGLTGFDTMKMIAEDDKLGLPVICHPALLGSFVSSHGSGMSHRVVFGQLPRIAGADATIYPNYGGRFSFSISDCKSIVLGTTEPMNPIKPIFSMPGGGMSFERIPEMIETYGKDMIFLIGGALHKIGPDLTENCKKYLDAIR